MQELISKLSMVVANVENSDIEPKEKMQIKSKFKQALDATLDATKKINSDVSSVKNIILESGILYKNVSKVPALSEAIFYFKKLFGI